MIQLKGTGGKAGINMEVQKIANSLTHHKGTHFNFKTDRVILRNGSEIIRDVVEHPGSVAVLPILDEELVLIRQYRYPAGKVLIEIPAGTLEIGESPPVCAARELTEETGYAASNWSKLLSCYMTPGYSTEKLHIYIAEGLTQIGAEPEEDEFIKIETYSFNKVLEMIEDNIIEDSKTITGILAYLTRA
jgi:ADP-ribose pyrophosphatase